jgi:hypothetical protein
MAILGGLYIYIVVKFSSHDVLNKLVCLHDAIIFSLLGQKINLTYQGINNFIASSYNSNS